MDRWTTLAAALLGTSLALTACTTPGGAPAAPADAIAGTVTGPTGPEAGVWVIAETRDLPTRYAKVVVTDDRGRFVLPQMPDANFKVWVRGYGIQDTGKLDARPGRTLSFQARAATPAQDAQNYPGVYWYSMISLPPASDFPGTGDKGNGIAPTMKAQHHWVDALKNSCQSCHALGSRGIREVPAMFKDGRSSEAAWAMRTQAGQAMVNMQTTLGYMGADRAFRMFADWTDRIAAGELPFARPERPRGVERNVVYTMWDWATPKQYQHDAVSTDKRNPRVNANGLVYGSPEESTDLIPTLDPVRHVASSIRHPYKDPKTPSSSDLPRGPSAYWGMEPIWDGHTSIHNPMIDEQGKVWFTARHRPMPNPDFCKEGSSHPSAKVAPQAGSPRQLSRYDPATGKWDLIDTCFSTHHLYFARDPDQTLWTSAGGPGSGVVGWLNTRKWRETGDAAASQGWTPLIVDTNGNGRRDAWTVHGQPFDPAKDRRVMAGFYAVQPSTVDGAIWGQSMERGFARMDQPGWLIRLLPGSEPSSTALAEIFQSPPGTFGLRGLDVDSTGLVWTPLASGQLASFDRSKCKGPLTGAPAADGTHCYEGWTLYRFPGPQFKGQDPSGSADHAYYVWVDLHDTLGLGKDVPIVSANGGESVLALVKGAWVNLRVPYPMGFFSKNFDGRIDDPSAGWKGKGLWTTSGTRTNFHGEGGVDASPKAFKVQMRPDPLAY